MKLRLKKQHDESDCAAACLEMILDYYGKSVNLRKLRTDAGTDILGTTGYGISVCAEKKRIIMQSIFCAGQMVRRTCAEWAAPAGNSYTAVVTLC